MTAPAESVSALRLDLFGLAPLAVEPELLARLDARALARRLARGVPFARLVECRRGTVGDLVVMDLDVETPQHTAHDIRPEERIGVWFQAHDGAADPLPPPEVFALREDFPADVPHSNLRPYEYPRSLCLYDVPFAELRATWTPGRLVTLMREWLRLTARGELHAADQPLEPLMIGAGWIVLPNVLRERDAGLGVTVRGQIGEMPVLVAVPAADVSDTERRFVVACIRCRPRTHGVIRRAPVTLADLHDLLAPEDDVRAQVVAAIRRWKEEGIRLDARVAIVLIVPLQREEGAETEIDQPWAFLTVQTVEEVGQSLGLWQKTEFGLAGILGPNVGDGGTAVSVLPLNAYFEHRRVDGARYNGRAVDDRHYLAVGAGALGSQVLDSVARAAFGRWTVVDGDVLLPHNIARHELGVSAVGWEKAQGVVVGAMRDTAADAKVHDWIAVDVLDPGDRRADLERAYTEADAIVDMSASIAVARTLARDVQAPGRRISLFLNPTGTDLTLLAESADRAIRLDAVEMQYYRAIARNPALADTLRGAVARERYGRSCRDVSSRLPHARVKTLAGLGAAALEQVVESPGAVIRVWRLAEATLSVEAVDVPVHPAVDVAVGDWRLVIDEGLITYLAELRVANLPNETGGVLLGTVDVARRVVYVVDSIPSPPDSEEWPTLYIRGAAGLKERVDEVQAATAGQLHYIGEWHSHPQGCPPLPSPDDLQVFAWITEALDADDLPAVMMIAGESGIAMFVGTISADVSPNVLRTDTTAAPPA